MASLTSILMITTVFGIAACVLFARMACYAWREAHNSHNILIVCFVERVLFDVYLFSAFACFGVSIVSISAILLPEMGQDHRMMGLWWCVMMFAGMLFAGARRHDIKGRHPLQNFHDQGTCP